MAAFMVTEVHNHLDKPITLRQDDQFLRAHCTTRNKTYERNQKIPVGPGEGLTFRDLCAPWQSNGRLYVSGPHGRLEFFVGPVSLSSDDHLRGFDKQQREVHRVRIGPQGPAFVAQLTVRLVLRKDDGMVWQIVDGHQIGATVLREAGQVFKEIGPDLLKKLIEAVPVP